LSLTPIDNSSTILAEVIGYTRTERHDHNGSKISNQVTFRDLDTASIFILPIYDEFMANITVAKQIKLEITIVSK
jgi:hypothetical protein